MLYADELRRDPVANLKRSNRQIKAETSRSDSIILNREFIALTSLPFYSVVYPNRREFAKFLQPQSFDKADPYTAIRHLIDLYDRSISKLEGHHIFVISSLATLSILPVPHRFFGEARNPVLGVPPPKLPSSPTPSAPASTAVPSARNI